MNSRLILATGLCAGLAACGGIGADNARWYDPQSARADGPVGITLVGAAAADQPAITSAIAQSLQANGAQAGTLTPIGTPVSGYRVTVVYGPVAHDLVASGDADNFASPCRTIDSQAGAALASSPPAAGGPVAALMCYRNQYEAVAYANLGNGESPASVVPGLVQSLFPPPGAND